MMYSMYVYINMYVYRKSIKVYNSVISKNILIYLINKQSPLFFKHIETFIHLLKEPIDTYAYINL